MVPLADLFNHAPPILESSKGDPAGSLNQDVWQYDLEEDDVEAEEDESETNQAQLESDYWVCGTCGALEECDHDRDDELMNSGQKSVETPIARVAGARRPAGDAKQDTVDIRSVLPIAAGEEVFNSYGDLSNASLVAHYGFMLEANARDLITFKFAQVVADPDAEGAFLEFVKRWKGTPLRQEENELVHKGRPSRAQSIYFINADARLSQPLYLLILFAHLYGMRCSGTPDKLYSELDRIVAAGLDHRLVVDFCQARLNLSWRPKLGGTELLDIAEVGLSPIAIPWQLN